MKTYQLYINGKWQDASSQEKREVLNPTTEAAIAQVQMANPEDVDQAVAAAKAAFPAWNQLPRQERANYLQKIADGIRERQDDLIDSIVQELGSSRSYVAYQQVLRSAEELEASIQASEAIDFEQTIDNSTIIKEGFGVVAAICPWNFPLNQIQRKMTPALLAGNTMVVKPATETPGAAMILAEIIDQVGLPAGVFNLITGSGAETGDYLAGHPDVRLISFTGSTQVGKSLYDKAKTSVKKLVLELGGKSPLVLLPEGDIDLAVKTALDTLTNNSGQICTALSRLIVPNQLVAQVEQVACDYLDSLKMGDPDQEDTVIGPLVSAKQQATVLKYIEEGLASGGRIVSNPKPCPDQGFYVTPTIFSGITNEMPIAREEIFGPVLVIIGYETPEEALEIANDTPYGLSGAVVGPDQAALDFARQMRTGNIMINGAGQHHFAPFGGYRESGLGRERGAYGIEDYLEVKAIFHPK